MGGIVNSIFGGGKQESSNVQNPYAAMPDWLKEAWERTTERQSGVQEAAMETAKQPYTPGSNRMLDMAFDAAKDGDNYGMLEQRATGAAGAAKSRLGGNYTLAFSPNVRKGHLNPYLDEVVGATEADLDRAFTRRKMEEDMRFAKSGGVAGSRAAVAQGIAEGEHSRALASELGKLRSRGFEFATEQGQRDMDRRLDVAKARTGRDLDLARLYDDLATGRLERTEDRSDLLSRRGMERRGMAKEVMREDHDRLAWLTQMLGGTSPTGQPTPQVSSSSSSGGGGWGNLIGLGALGAGLYVSDEREKDVESEDRKDLVGIKAKRYTYKRDPEKRKHLGLMAQEVEKRIPEAVLEVQMPDGEYRKAVDVYAVTASNTGTITELDERVSRLEHPSRGRTLGDAA